MEKAYAYSKTISSGSIDQDYPARLFKGVLAVNYAGALRAMIRLADANPVRVAISRKRSGIEA